MKSDSARRDGWTSSPTPKKRQKLMMSGRQRMGSIWGFGSPVRSFSSTCNRKMCTSNAFALILPERTNVMYDSLHLDRTFENALRRNGLRFHGSETCNLELAGLEPTAPFAFLLGYRVLSSRESQAVHMTHQFL